jgi:steroid 5-alpha reductase family enzyme
MEQGIWIIFYLFSVAATGSWLNWSMAGSLLLLILFKGSSDFSEEISATKYQEYKNYQRKVPRFIPFLNFRK